MHDLVIRNATVVDGSGDRPFVGDVAVDGELIAEVGDDVGAGRREVDADGLLLTPGWVDIHSHYDGQATWDPHLVPSGAHGVTTTVFGNCGVGFAPAKAEDRSALITIMEGVEDIPGAALWEGLTWDWETFPDYLDALESTGRSVDVAALLPHSAVRAYVMGAEPSIRGVATDDQIDRMKTIVRDAVASGAFGLSTSRTKLHLGSDGKAVPGSFVELEELLELAGAVRDGGGGIIQGVTDWTAGDPAREFAWFRRISQEFGLPVAFALVQDDQIPGNIYQVLDLLAEARADGLDVHAGVGVRPVGMLINLESEIHPLSGHPSYQEIASLPADERVARMRDPEFKRRLLSEDSTITNSFWRPRLTNPAQMFVLGDPPEYEPGPERSVSHLAKEAGCSPDEYVYDFLVERGRSDWIMIPLFNYSDGDLAPQLDMMRHPETVISLADGGAHCRLICDASAPTYLLTHWVRDRDRGERLPLERAVQMQTQETAAAWGFTDRGEIRPGLRADLNLIDFDALRLLPPRWATDLPADGKRLLQDAEGYVATFQAGRQTWSDGSPTGVLPGRLVRGFGRR
ncbi:MAG: amidohydrolase [Acidimicrobiaceae bacterium]|nr:amidohydrolase [Acidimicrobiaceae bacterium]